MSSEISEMSDARRRAEARKQKILAKGAERIAAAKGEGSLSEDTHKDRPIATRKAKEMGLSDVAVSGVSAQSDDSILIDELIAEANMTIVDSKPHIDLNAALESRKKLEEEIVRCTEEFDRKQISDRSNHPSEVTLSSTSSPTTVDQKEETPARGDITTLAVKSVPTLPKLISRSQISGILKLVIIIFLGATAGDKLRASYSFFDLNTGYFNALDTRAYQNAHPAEFNAIFSPVDDIGSGGMFESVYALLTEGSPNGDIRDRARELLREFTHSHYAQEMGSLSDGSFAPKMAPEDALAAGGTLYSLLGIVRSPLASVLMAWIVSNFISSSVICDVLLRGRVISAADEALATSKSTLIGTALKLVMGEYSIIVDWVLDVIGQFCLHILTSLLVCAYTLHCISPLHADENALPSPIDEL